MVLFLRRLKPLKDRNSVNFRYVLSFGKLNLISFRQMWDLQGTLKNNVPCESYPCSVRGVLIKFQTLFDYQTSCTVHNVGTAWSMKRSMHSQIQNDLEFYSLTTYTHGFHCCVQYTFPWRIPDLLTHWFLRSLILYATRCPIYVNSKLVRPWEKHSGIEHLFIRLRRFSEFT